VRVGLSALDAVRWTRGELLRGSEAAHFRGVSIDTRSLETDELFVAIRGENHDAHRFLADAVTHGATGLVVEAGHASPEDLAASAVVIAVEDGTRALGALAAGHRAQFRGPLVAITGSNGKTTTKEMCASILSVEAPCLKNRDNLNNQYGLPLTLLARCAEQRFAVVEIGMNHRGEIAPLARIARPTVGVITNVGTAHIEFLKSREAIATEKGDLLTTLPADGTAVLNADDPLAMAQSRRTDARVVSFGAAGGADVRAEQIREHDRGFAFALCAPEGKTDVEVNGLGPATLANALAAAAAALAAGVSLDAVREGLARHRPVSGRMERIVLPQDITLINDAYNANPQSLALALTSLAEHKGSGRALAVLGDMGELGSATECEHRAAGELVCTLGIDFLLAFGDHAQRVASAAIDAGMDPAHVHVESDHDALAARVRELARKDDWVLVKGSRSMHMERVVAALARTEERD
jgi:UDP-N-acetylmuramoyl-tripeptide--D-alanyl-D-alanine ligase